uniref:Sulfotransferase n=1 Tax=Kalanchoe fedtschenkoi TaxID=63787 RepID=A0A7N0T112_KALFE
MEQTEATSASVEETSQKEFDSLIQSLPKIPNWARGHSYKYEGFWYWEDVLRPILSCKKHFRAQDSDIILSSFPKCGTTWLKAIVAIPDFSNMPAPRLFAAHSPVLSLGDEVTNSGYCLISSWHFVNKLRSLGSDTTSFCEAFDSFCGEEDIYGPFWDHILGHWRMSLVVPKSVLFLTYEQISEQPNHYVKKIAEFLGCPFSTVEEDEEVVNGVVKMCSFNHLSQLEVNKSGVTKLGHDNRLFFRRGEIGDSNNLLTSEMINKMDQIAQKKFSPYGLKM